MSSGTSTTSTLDEAGVLAVARRARAEANAAEARVLSAAVEWARLHQVTDLDDAATWCTSRGEDTGIPIAGEGCPLVSRVRGRRARHRPGSVGRVGSQPDRPGTGAGLPAAEAVGPGPGRIVGAVAGPTDRRGNPQRLPVGRGCRLGRRPGRAVRPQDRAGPDPAAGGDRDHPTHAAARRRAPRAGCRAAVLHHRPRPGLLRRHQPGPRRARPRRRTGPRRRRHRRRRPARCLGQRRPVGCPPSRCGRTDRPRRTSPRPGGGPADRGDLDRLDHRDGLDLWGLDRLDHRGPEGSGGGALRAPLPRRPDLPRPEQPGGAGTSRGPAADRGTDRGMVPTPRDRQDHRQTRHRPEQAARGRSPTRYRTGSPNPSDSGTRPVCTPSATGPPGAATWTTSTPASTPTTVAHPTRPRRRISHHCAGCTTG